MTHLTNKYVQRRYITREEYERKKREEKAQQIQQDALREHEEKAQFVKDNAQKDHTVKKKAWNSSLKRMAEATVNSPISQVALTMTGLQVPVGIGRAIASGASPKDFGRELVGRPVKAIGELAGAALSGEAALNLAPGKPGTYIRDQIERVPYVGKPLGVAADTLASPLSIATIGAGGALAGGISKGALGMGMGPMRAKALGGLVSPALSGGLARRAVGEAAIGLGATYAPEGVRKIPGEQKLPGAIRGPLELGSSFVGGGLALGAAGRATGRIAPKMAADAFGEKPTFIRMQTHEIADALGKPDKEVAQLRKLDIMRRAGTISTADEEARKAAYTKLHAEYKEANNGRGAQWVLPSSARPSMRETQVFSPGYERSNTLDDYVGEEVADKMRGLERVATRADNSSKEAIQARAELFRMHGIKTLDEQNRVNPHLLGVIEKAPDVGEITSGNIRIKANRLKAQGYDTSDIESAFDEWKGIVRSEFDDAEEFASAKSDAWDSVTEAFKSVSKDEGSVGPTFVEISSGRVGLKSMSTKQLQKMLKEAQGKIDRPSYNTDIEYQSGLARDIETVLSARGVSGPKLGIIRDNPDDITDPRTRELMGLEPIRSKTLTDIPADEGGLQQAIINAQREVERARFGSNKELEKKAGQQLADLQEEAARRGMEPEDRGLRPTGADPNSLMTGARKSATTTTTALEEQLFEVRNNISRAQADGDTGDLDRLYQREFDIRKELEGRKSGELTPATRYGNRPLEELQAERKKLYAQLRDETRGLQREFLQGSIKDLDEEILSRPGQDRPSIFRSAGRKLREGLSGEPPIARAVGDQGGPNADDLDPIVRELLGLDSGGVFGEGAVSTSKVFAEDANKAKSDLREQIEELDTVSHDPLPVRGDASDRVSSNEFMERQIGGGASGALVTPQPVGKGYTFSEHAKGIANTVFHFLDGRGIKNSEVATPIVREYTRQHKTLVNQGTFLESRASQLARTMKVDSKTGLTPQGITIQDMARNYSKWRSQLTPHQQNLMDALKKDMTDWKDTLLDYNVDLKKVKGLNKPIADPNGFWLPQGSPADKRMVRQFATMSNGMRAGVEYPSFEQAVREYTSDVANLASEKWLAEELKGLKGQLPTTAQGMQQVNLRGVGKLQLPKEHAQVVNQAIRKAKGLDQSDVTKLIDIVNKTGRAFWASADFSWFGVNGLLTMAENPKLAPHLLKIGLQSIGDPTVAAKAIAELDAKNLAAGRPVFKDYVRNGLHMAGNHGSGMDIDLSSGVLEKVGKLPIIKQTTASYSNTGDIARYFLADMYFDQIEKNKGLLKYVGLGTGGREGKASWADSMKGITSAANRATGYSATGLSDIAGATLFAPRFLISQLEILTKQFEKGTIEGQLARRQMAKLIGLGVSLTWLINESRGESTSFDPRDSNFMRIRDVKGADISVFGPWDSLVRGIAKSPKEPTYLLRSKSSPIVSIAWDMLSGESTVGDKTRTPYGIFQSILPFSARDVKEQTPIETAVGVLGVKASELSSSEILTKKLSNEGIEKDDPDYLIKRRDYLKEHPGDRPKARDEEAKFAEEIKGDIEERSIENERRTSNDEQTLVDFRTSRTLLLTERRNKLEEVVKGIKNKPDTKQEKWLKSYYEIFDQEGITDPVTKKIDPKAMDAAEAHWVSENGAEALSFIQRYTLSGSNPIEKEYLTDIRKLSDAGYFDMDKYRNLKSDLPEDELEDLRDQVSSARAGDPKLAKLDYARAARVLLKREGYDDVVIRDVINIGSQKYLSPEYKAMKIKYSKELMWFNPKVLYSDYQNLSKRVKAS